jgi:SAM-dependent methyltransferase
LDPGLEPDQRRIRMVHHDTCPLCSSDKISLHFRCTDHFISRETFGIYKCDSCSFEFTQDYPDITEIGKYYESTDYISHSDTSKGFSNKVYRLTRNLMLIYKRTIVTNLTGLQTGSLLDIGSGTGYFGSAMKNAGWQVKGVEINEKALEYSKSKFGLETEAPEHLKKMISNSFDCITLWHVLEHFHDPFKYTADIIRLLKPGGLCLIALPNCISFDAAHYREFWAAYDVPRHLWHFSPSTFGNFLEKTGFEIEKIKNLPADVFYISILSERYKGSKFSFPAGMIKGLFFSFLTAFKSGRSSSVIYILRKPIVQ